MPTVSFFDLEVNPSSKQILDIGAISSDGLLLHRNDLNELVSFLSKADFICGHNIINHDLIYIAKHLGANSWGEERAIDTLFLSPLLFPKNPYHNLLKDDKLQTDELNNPLNDSQKAKNLFFDEVAAFQKLDDEFKEIIY